MKNLRNKFRGAAALALLAGMSSYSGAAYAQDAAPPAGEQVESGLEEIVVTAQRRKENLQSVPISVTAITANNLAAGGVQGLTQLSQAVPSVQLTRSATSAIFFIRGVGNSSGGTGEEGANAFYIDGVYLGDLAQAGLEFNNIERVEVLKGPQGTLFGRNSSGGLIHIITKDPGSELKVNGKVGYGNYETYSGQFYVASPLTDKLGIDFSFAGKDQNEGFGRNFAKNKDVQLGWFWAARTKLVWRPGDATKVSFSADYRRAKDDYTNTFAQAKESIGIDGSTYLGDYNINTTDPAYLNAKVWGVALNIEHELDWATLTSITARRKVRSQSFFDADYIPAPITRGALSSGSQTFQQEFRLASTTTNPLSWQVGLFYYEAIANVFKQELRGTGLGGINSGNDITARMKTTSYAAFGELTYNLTDTTHITGGLRYTHDKRQFNALQVPVNLTPGSALYTAFDIGPRAGTITYGRATYRIAVRQELTSRINVYASYNRGFKSGIFALQSPANPPVKPQTIDAFEVGLKSRLFDNMLRFNVAGFHYKIKDYQVRSSPAPGQTLLLNAASVKVDGIEAEIELAPAEGLRLNANFTYLNSRFTSFPGSPFTYPRPAICNAAGSTPPGMSSGPATGGNLTCFGDARGNQTPLSPKFASSVGASYRTEVGNGDELIVTGLWSYSGRYYYEPDNRLKQKAFSLFNGSIEYRPAPNWGIELWGKNITDKRYRLTSVGGSTADRAELAAPRTYGVNVKFDF